MTASASHEFMEAYFRAALASRRETFLARYPRKLKLFVASLILLGVGLLMVQVVTSVYDAYFSVSEEPVQELDQTTELLPSTLKAPRDVVKRPTHSKPQNEAERKAIELNDSDDLTQRMAPAPDLALVEETPSGVLPRIGADGRRPWQAYARPYDQADPRPRIAVVMTDMGLSKIATDAAMRRVPSNVTLAFDVQGENVGAWLERARNDGHETLVSLPMEPIDYPRSDPGPGTLLTTLPNSDNVQRMFSALKVGSGYVGVTTLTGSRFTTDPSKLEPVLSVIRSRGLLLLDTRVGAHSVLRELAVRDGIPVAQSFRVIDATPAPQAIDAALMESEQTARVEGSVVILASPLPVTLERIENWVKKLPERGISLAPLSAVVE